MCKLYVVGIGAGSYDMLTVGAVRALESAEVICGYTEYVKLIRPYFPDKEYIATPMMQEVERCRIAVESAKSGRPTAMICSGDAGVYGMASPIYEVAGEDAPEIVVIPGVTAACSGAALLGAPLTHDFAVISLSDLLTPWEVIEARLRAAAESDLHKPPETVCGVVRNVSRDGESHELMTLRALVSYEADMFTTVFVGNRSTKIINGKMITPRGYRDV